MQHFLHGRKFVSKGNGISEPVPEEPRRGFQSAIKSLKPLSGQTKPLRPISAVKPAETPSADTAGGGGLPGDPVPGPEQDPQLEVSPTDETSKKQPRVEVEEIDGVVQKIIVTCSCGDRIELICEYPES